MKVKIFIAISFLVAVVAGAFYITDTKPQIKHNPDLEISIPEESTIKVSEESDEDNATTSTNFTPPDMLPDNSTSPTLTNNSPEIEARYTPPTSTSEVVSMAWIYPSEPGCTAPAEYKDGREIDILKPEFFTINGGKLILLDNTNSSCNGYSKKFVTELKKYSKEQYITVSSASASDMETFIKTALSNPADIGTLVRFVVDNGLTGIELDFEDFGGWSQSTYQEYLRFVERLGTELHLENKKLMLDGPAIANSTEQSWFAWKYEDFVSLPVDQIVVMAYDYQFDHGTGQPVAPLAWIKEVTTWASARYPKSRLTIGIPSYGYEGVIGKRPYIRTYDQLKNKPGFSTASRNKSSGEMTWKSGNTVYFYQDQESLRQKIKVVTDLNINSISIWHLGGNVWYR